MNAPVTLSPEQIAQGQLEAYNAQDVEAFCDFFADAATLGGLNGEITTRGLAAIRERHVQLFADFPQNRVELMNRMVIGATVIDHERVIRGPGAEPFEVAAIYTIADGKVVRVDYVK